MTAWLINYINEMKLNVSNFFQMEDIMITKQIACIRSLIEVHFNP
jgi:hypothetical protein